MYRPGSEPWHPADATFPRIWMFLFRPDNLKAGAALIQEATAYLEKRAPGQEIEALHAQSGYPFYRGLWLGGEPMGHSDDAPRIVRLPFDRFVHNVRYADASDEVRPTIVPANVIEVTFYIGGASFPPGRAPTT